MKNLKTKFTTYFAVFFLLIIVFSLCYNRKVQYRAYITNLSNNKKTEVWVNSKNSYYYSGKYPLGNQKVTKSFTLLVEVHQREC